MQTLRQKSITKGSVREKRNTGRIERGSKTEGKETMINIKRTKVNTKEIAEKAIETKGEMVTTRRKEIMKTKKSARMIGKTRKRMRVSLREKTLTTRRRLNLRKIKRKQKIEKIKVIIEKTEKTKKMAITRGIESRGTITIDLKKTTMLGKKSQFKRPRKLLV